MRTVVCFSLFFCSFLVFAQMPYQKAIGGLKDDAGYSVKKLNDGSVVVFGVTASYGHAKQMYLFKLNPEGELLWSKTYGGKKPDVGNKLIKAHDGGFLLMGYSSSFENVRKGVFVVKVDDQGNVEWSKTYGGDLIDLGLDIITTSDGGYAIVGETNSFEAWDYDIFCLKLDGNGQREWANVIGADSIDYGFSIVEVDDGYVIGCETTSFEGSDWDILLTKINKKGDVNWSKLYKGARDDNGDHLIRIGDEHFGLVGSTESAGKGTRDILFMKTDLKGDVIQWQTMGGSVSQEPKYIKKVEKDGYIIGGFSNSFNPEHQGEDALIVRLAENGFLKYSKTFGGVRDEFIWALDADDDMVTLVGNTNSFTEEEEENYVYVVNFKDKRRVMNCEMSNVQMISIPVTNEIKVSEVELKFKSADFDEHDVSVISDDVDSQVLDICIDGELLIDDIIQEEEHEEYEFQQQGY